MGVVDKPTVADKYYVHADIGGNASIIIPFQNPFYEDVVIDIELKETLQHNEGKVLFYCIKMFILLFCENHFVIPEFEDIRLVGQQSVLKTEKLRCREDKTKSLI